MAATSHNPEDGLPWLELGEVLRPAVDQVRQAPPPPEAMARALERARHIDRRRARPWISRRLQLLASGAVAATLLLALGLRFGGYPQGGFQAGTRDGGTTAGNGQAGDRGPVALPQGRSHVVLVGNTRLLGHGEPGDDVLPIGLIHQGSNWADWERAQALRELVRGMPPIDRKGVEAYLRHLAPGAGGVRVVWRRDSRPLPQARVQDDTGRELTLQGAFIQARIEGPRARTLVDLIFKNLHAAPLQGTLEVPLPEGASPSFFALFPGQSGTPVVAAPNTPPPPRGPQLPTPVEAMRRLSTDCWGQPRQAQVIAAYPGELAPAPTELSHSISPDAAPTPPASTFRGPIAAVRPGGMVRILVAYEELLPLVSGRLVYRHALPTVRLHELNFTLQIDRSLARNAQIVPADAVLLEEDEWVTYRRTWRGVSNPGMVVFQCTPRDPTIQATSGGDAEGPCHLFARLRPHVADRAVPAFARHAIFLLDTSSAEDSRRFDLCVRLMRSILEADSDITRFNILTFSTGSAWMEPRGWLANTRQGRETALSRLDGIVLEGATDLSAALERLRSARFLTPGTPVDLFLLSDGRLNWGETDLARLTARFETRHPHRVRWHCYHTGLGEENAELFAALTRRGGGVYRCGGEKDLPAAARAHRRPCLLVKQVRFVGGPQARDVLVAGRRAAVYPGGELLVAARLERPGRTRIVLEGELAGKPVVQEFPVEVTGDGQLAARGWGELAVASLLAVNDPALEPLALAYASTFGIASRATVFALTDDKMPAPANPEREYARLVKGELGGFLTSTWAGLGQPLTAGQLRARLSSRIDHWSPSTTVRKELRHLLGTIDETLPALPSAELAMGPLSRALADADYLSARQHDRKQIEPFLDEASRRARGGDAAGAIRVLASLVEEHPGQADVVRLVGSRLLAMGRASLAADLLIRLVESQPADPASHRAAAIALDDAGRPGLAALHYEAALAQLGGRGGWHLSVRTEYVNLLARLQRDANVPAALRNHLKARLDELGRPATGALVVTATWNTTASRVDLAVSDPEGRLNVVAGTPDRGARQGPRLYRLTEPTEGTYEVFLRLAQTAPETMAETCVRVEVVRHAGTDREQAQTHTVLLRRPGERVRVCTVEP